MFPLSSNFGNKQINKFDSNAWDLCLTSCLRTTLSLYMNGGPVPWCQPSLSPWNLIPACKTKVGMVVSPTTTHMNILNGSLVITFIQSSPRGMAQSCVAAFLTSLHCFKIWQLWICIFMSNSAWFWLWFPLRITEHQGWRRPVQSPSSTQPIPTEPSLLLESYEAPGFWLISQHPGSTWQ